MIVSNWYIARWQGHLAACRLQDFCFVRNPQSTSRPNRHPQDIQHIRRHRVPQNLDAAAVQDYPVRAHPPDIPRAGYTNSGDHDQQAGSLFLYVSKVAACDGDYSSRICGLA